MRNLFRLKLSSHEARFQRTEGQSGWMGVTVTPKCKEGAHWTRKERKDFGSSDQKFFDHHTY